MNICGTYCNRIASTHFQDSMNHKDDSTMNINRIFNVMDALRFEMCNARQGFWTSEKSITMTGRSNKSIIN